MSGLHERFHVWASREVSCLGFTRGFMSGFHARFHVWVLLEVSCLSGFHARLEVVFEVWKAGSSHLTRPGSHVHSRWGVGLGLGACEV